jgi:hypothetical protein
VDAIALVIFDYSGTLSLGAAAFGRPGTLQRHLESSGLAGLGFDTPARYWRGLVAATWENASTSGEGFKSIAARRIQELAGPATEPAEIRSALDRFVDAYMHHSRIASTWQPLLADIQVDAGTLGLVATDHYAEATAALREHLAVLGIDAVSAVQAAGIDPHKMFLIANSADIGCAKADPRFWLNLRQTCLSRPLSKVVLVDDFGSNEQDQSGYADTARIAARIEATRQSLADVFGPEPQVVQFTVGENIEGAIAAATKTVRKALAS